MCSLSSPLFRTNSVKSLREPTVSTLISSTTPVVFISVWRSYLGEPLLELFCETAAAAHSNTNPATVKQYLRLPGRRTTFFGGRVMFFRSSGMAPPGKPDGEGGSFIIFVIAGCTASSAQF